PALLGLRSFRSRCLFGMAGNCWLERRIHNPQVIGGNEMSNHIYALFEAAFALIGVTLLALAFSACTTAPVASVQQSLSDSIRVVNPAAIRAQRACEGRYKPEWCSE